MGACFNSVEYNYKVSSNTLIMLLFVYWPISCFILPLAHLHKTIVFEWQLAIWGLNASAYSKDSGKHAQSLTIAIDVYLYVT